MKLIGIGGYARCGKDTFVGIAAKILSKNGYTYQKLSFADALKNDLDEWLKEKYGISVWTTNDEEKALIRPFLVAHGCGKRIQTQGKYWIDKINNKIQQQLAMQERDQYQDHVDVFFVSDVRFQNEAKWVKEMWNGEIIHLKRWSVKEVRDGYGDTVFAKVYDPAPNDEELKQDPFVYDLANQRIEWEDKGKLTPAEAMENPYLQNIVLDALNNTKIFKHPSTGILQI